MNDRLISGDHTWIHCEPNSLVKVFDRCNQNLDVITTRSIELISFYCIFPLLLHIFPFFVLILGHIINREHIGNMSY